MTKVDEHWQWWEPIVAPDGVVDIEQVKKELSDYSMLMDMVSRVYDYATGGKVSKPFTDVGAVKALIDDHANSIVEEAIAEARMEWEEQE